MSIPGAVTITRKQMPDGPVISIEIEDSLSARVFVEIHLTLETFAEAVTGLSSRPGEMEVQNFDLVGKKLEIKSEIVPQVGFNATKTEIHEALAPFEVDGWTGSRKDVTNHHNFCGNNVRVKFRRYVPATEADIEEARKKNE